VNHRLTIEFAMIRAKQYAIISNYPHPFLFAITFQSPILQCLTFYNNQFTFDSSDFESQVLSLQEEEKISILLLVTAVDQLIPIKFIHQIENLIFKKEDPSFVISD
jgi:hypothetical protein